MDNPDLLGHLQAGIGELLEIAGKNIQHSSETDSEFSLRLSVDPASLEHVLLKLAPSTDTFAAGLEYHIQQGTGRASLKTNGLFADDWLEDPDLSPPDIDTKTASIYTNLTYRLSQKGGNVLIGSLVQDLDQLRQAGASVEVYLNLFIDKRELIQSLGARPNVSRLIYIVADKFLHNFQNSEIPDLCRLLVPASEHTLVIMLGDASGIAEGPNIKLLGRDQWAVHAELDSQSEKTETAKVKETVNFRNEECHWEIVVSNLTPYHLYVKNSNLDCIDVLESIAELRDRLSVAYLADHLYVDNKRMKCEFMGYKRVQISFPPLDNKDSALPIFRLFAWAYENASSDKLGIVRNIVSLQLGENPEDNYDILRRRSSEILGTAKSNFQLFLRRSVELYFDKRLKISEFLQKFGEEVSESVSSLTSDLIGDLYKTIGVILGVVIAFLLDPKQTARVTWLATLLYLIYIIFILAYLLSSAYFRFTNKVHEYKHNVSELRDILSEEEISRVQGSSYQRARFMFLIFFGLTYLIYASLGSVAFLVIQFFGGFL